MKTVVIGLNHKTADVDLREKLAFNGPKLEEGIRQIRALPEIRETIIISTCNRVEIYLTVKDVGKAFEAVKDFFVRFFEIRKESLDNALYLYDGHAGGEAYLQGLLQPRFNGGGRAADTRPVKGRL